MNGHSQRRRHFQAQSFLANIPTIVVGWRTDGGQMTQLEEMQTMLLPRRVRPRPDAWDPNICLNFADQFFTFLKTTLLQHEDACVWSILFEPALGQIVLSPQPHAVQPVVPIDPFA